MRRFIRTFIQYLLRAFPVDTHFEVSVVIGSYYLPFCSQVNGTGQCATGTSHVIAPDIWLLGKNDFEPSSLCHRVCLLAGCCDQGARRER